MLEDKVLKMNDLVKIMEPNLQASEIIKKAKSTNVAAGIFGGIGGGLLGWTLGGLVGGRAPNIGVVGTGVGFILIGIPIQKNANKKLLQAVDIYNNDLMGFTKPLEKPQYELLVNNNGIGLQLSF